ncbi:hypothetical protein PspLS_10460 [Pyricularia sp. CBS 133598]|nr:hypothetical protein PspLS_10460 [Pyricularia sp. CBS 133598]
MASNTAPMTVPPAAPPSGMPIADTTAAQHEAAHSVGKEIVNADDIERNAGSVNADDKNESDASSEFKQDGVARAEAITKVWTTKTLWATFGLIYLVALVDSMLGNVEGALSPYVTSAFGRHGLISTTSIVSTILGGVITLSIAKMINIWGRMEGLAGMVFLITIGMIMKALCQNVETYAAAQVMYWVGHIGLLLIINVTVADMTTLRNRMIIFGFNTSPLIISFFTGPLIADRFLKEVNFRWAFGAFAIIMIATTTPIIGVFILNERKAKSVGLVREKSGRTFMESVKHYAVELDVVGLFLITIGASLLLLPFSLVNYVPGGWANGGLISMFVLGPALLAVFYIWEKKYAPVQFFPWVYLTNKTILGACSAYGLMFASIFCWDTYYYSYLQVAHSLSVVDASYTINSLSLSSAILGVFIGLLIRYTGKVKWVAMAGVPFMILGTALLVRFRTPETSIAVLVVLQVLVGLASGVFALCSQMAVMATVKHNEVAPGLALHGLFGAVGAAIGQAIAGGIWNNLLPFKLMEFLPEEAKADAWTIFGDIEVQQAATGAIRDAINAAYGDMQHKMVIAGCCFTPFVIGAIWLWEDMDVRKIDAERANVGNVF